MTHVIHYPPVLRAAYVDLSLRGLFVMLTDGRKIRVTRERLAALVEDVTDSAAIAAAITAVDVHIETSHEGRCLVWPGVGALPDVGFLFPVSVLAQAFGIEPVVCTRALS